VTLEIGTVPDGLPGGKSVTESLEANEDQAIVRLESGTVLLVSASALVLSPGPAASDTELAYVLYSFGTRLALTLR
jgi:hypothetical protein